MAHSASRAVGLCALWKALRPAGVVTPTASTRTRAGSTPRQTTMLVHGGAAAALWPAHDERQGNHAERGEGEEADDVDVGQHRRLRLQLAVEASHSRAMGTGGGDAAGDQVMRQVGAVAEICR